MVDGTAERGDAGVLPYLAWFEGGAFEIQLERFCDVGPEVWGRVRAELLATALVRVEDRVRYADKPYLGFHPTLPYAAAPEVGDKEEARKRFVEVYLWLAGSAVKAFQGAEHAGAMQAMAREEANIKRAVALAFEQGNYEMGAGLAETIACYLVSAGRVRDQVRFAAWVQEHMAEASGPAKWAIEMKHAWGLFRAGNEQAAVGLLNHQLVVARRVQHDRGRAPRWRAHRRARWSCSPHRGSA